ncbi:MAG: hypothetical protein ABI779_18895 [Acidobacteriota bacterium]
MAHLVHKGLCPEVDIRHGGSIEPQVIEPAGHASIAVRLLAVMGLTEKDHLMVWVGKSIQPKARGMAHPLPRQQFAH